MTWRQEEVTECSTVSKAESCFTWSAAAVCWGAVPPARGGGVLQSLWSCPVGEASEGREAEQGWDSKSSGRQAGRQVRERKRVRGEGVGVCTVGEDQQRENMSAGALKLVRRAGATFCERGAARFKQRLSERLQTKGQSGVQWRTRCQ